MKGKKVYLATIALGEYEESWELIIGIYENKEEIKDKIRQDKELLERLEDNYIAYNYEEDYKNYEEYLNECFEVIEAKIVEMTIE